MRDLLVVSMVAWGCIAALRRPWIGVLLWTWISLMNPHRLTFGFAYSLPLAQAAAIAVLLGLVMTKDRDSPFKGSPVVIFAILIVWITTSWALGLSPSDDYYQWNKVMKIDLMILVSLMLVRTKQHIVLFAAVAAGSLALLGAKGGVFTIVNGGNYRVWGPAQSFIEDNNEFALALVMTIPLLRFVQMQVKATSVRSFISLIMILCAAAALGSQSRGALVAISAMTVLLWWRGKNKIQTGVILVAVAVALLAFMPDSWVERMNTMTTSTYEEDTSAKGRVSAWWNAWGVAKDYPLGVGFNPGRPELFAKYSPYPDMVHAAHSIYFQMMGNHGFIGLALFVTLWGLTWRAANRVRKAARLHKESQWCVDLASMCQVSLIGYAIGGAFLSLAYFDLPYNIMMMVVLCDVWVRKKAWETEPPFELALPKLLRRGTPPGQRPTSA